MNRSVLTLLLLATACRNDRPAAPTAAESAQMNDADAMLNDLAKEEGPEADAPDPSNRSN